MKPCCASRWNPYVAGALIGVLSWVTFLTMNKALGTSTTMVHLSGAASALVAPEHLKENAYYAKEITAANPLFDWQFFLVLGLPLGAWLSAKLSGSQWVESVPKLWAWRFGSGRWKRYGLAFLGGVVLIYGARMAGGCTSGHGISGGLQLAVSSWTFFLAMFASGVATAFLIYGMEGRKHV
jgi:uncharacterized protein